MKAYPTDTSEKPKQVSEPDLEGSYTAGDYMKWTFEGLFELIHCKVFKMSPAPSVSHQKILGVLSDHFRAYFKKLQCTVLFAPVDVYLLKDGEELKKGRNVVLPDLLVVCDDSKLKDFGCVGAPDLVMEIISPNTGKKDLKLKFELYEEFGVREYWIVFPLDQIVWIYTRENGKYVRPKIYVRDEEARSEIFPELNVSLLQVFEKGALE